MAKSLVNAKSRRNNPNNKVIAALVGPLSFWLVLFLALPLIYVVLISFMNKGTYGGIDWTFTLKNYIDLWNPSYGKVIWKSIALAFNTSLICLLISMQGIIGWLEMMC